MVEVRARTPSSATIRIEKPNEMSKRRGSSSPKGVAPSLKTIELKVTANDVINRAQDCVRAVLDAVRKHYPGISVSVELLKASSPNSSCKASPIIAWRGNVCLC